MSLLSLLLWKNAILKSRHIVSTLSEIILPLLFIFLVIGLQSLDKDESMPDRDYTCPKRTSVSPTIFFPQEEGEDFINEIQTEVEFGSGLQEVPPFIYLLTLCPRIQRQIAFAPRDPNDPKQVEFINNFINDMDGMTKALRTSQWRKVSDLFNEKLGISVNFCEFKSLTKVYTSAKQLEDYIKSKDYGKDDQKPELWNDHGCPPHDIEYPSLHAAVIIDTSSNGKYEYELRLNFTAVPVTYEEAGLVDPLLKGADEEPQDKYMMSGFLTLQQALDRFIINKKVPVSDKLRDLAISQLCDSVMPIFFEFEFMLPPEFIPILESFDCVGLIKRESRFGGLNIDPLVLPASYIPNGIRMAEFPTEEYTYRPFYEKIENVFALILIITYLWPTSRLIRGIVHEKESRLRESMKMMGMPSSHLLAAWFITYGIIFFVIALLITLVSNNSVFKESDSTIIFTYFFLFGLSIIAYCFLISVLFSKAKTASTAGVTLFFMAFFGYFGVSSESATADAKKRVCILAPTAFGLGASILAEYEAAGEGVRWDNVHQTNADNQIPFSYILYSLVKDIILYMIFGWYLDQVLPQEYGVQRVWYFPFTYSYWCGSKSETLKNGGNLDPESLDQSTSSNHIPKEPIGPELRRLASEKRSVKFINLRKEFDTPVGKKVAVEGLDLEMYEGQIFVLLGNNGAGKTTALSCLTGMIPPTSGTAEAYGHNIVEDGMDEVRSILGVCPQHDILWDELTVEEHLQFYASLKGVKGKEALEEAVSNQIAQVALTEKRKVQACNLSGGQKRKLSVAIALIGDSKIVVLDEPTSGMDPWSRRSTWSLLQNNRANRVMILTTHFMDEADILGDRIGIMGEGQLRCVGSPMFLKSHYGVGYTLTIELEVSNTTNSNEEQRVRDRVQEMIKTYLPDAKELSSVGAEVSLQVPFSASHVFPTLFDHLDAKKNEYRVAAYGVSVTTLEEVFLQVAKGEDATRKLSSSKLSITDQSQLLTKSSSNSAMTTTTNNNNTIATAAVVTDGNGKASSPLQLPLLGNDQSSSAYSTYEQKPKQKNDVFHVQLRALLLKRFQYAKRDSRSMCCNLLLPIVLLALGLGLLKAFPLQEPPSVRFDNVAHQWNQDIDVVPYGVSQDAQSAWASEVMKNVHPSVPYQSTDYPRDLQNVCEEDKKGDKDIRDGQNIKGFSHWLLTHKGKFDAPIVYGAYQFDDSDINQLVTVTIFQNSSALHAPGIYMNMLSQALARTIHNDPNLVVSTINSPFPFTARFRELLDTFQAVSAAITIMIAYSFVPAAIAIFIVREREVSAKHQQIISGVSLPAYWISSYIWDMTMYLIPWSLSVLSVYLFKIEALTGTENLSAVALLFFCYGLAIAPYTYLLSFFFTSHSTAQNIVLLLTFVTGLVLMIASFVMAMIESTHDTNRILEYFYRLFPGFCLGNGLLNLTINTSLKTFGTDEFKAQSAFAWDVVGVDICYLLIESVVYFSLTLAVDVSMSYPKVRTAISDKWSKYVEKPIKSARVWVSSWFNFSSKPSLSRSSSQVSTDANSSLSVILPLSNHADAVDEDVEAEAKRVAAEVESGNIKDIISLYHIRKQYPDGKVAVHDMTFGIPAGECFGFLGINGAGKTTTMKIITHDILPSSGTGYLMGKNILEDQSEIRRKIGYCPQFEALLDLLTVREHLQLYARLKCVPEEEINAVVQKSMEELDLAEFSEKLAYSLSGGNKRKLSVAIATIGNPSIVFLDEPTTGVDPFHRRMLWGAISNLIRRGTDTNQLDNNVAVVLTTHSMEEAAALCSRVGIMVGGKLRCLGSVQHLKSRFGIGHMVEIQLEHPTSEEIEDIVQRIGGSNKRIAYDESATGDKSYTTIDDVCDALGNQHRADMIKQHTDDAFPVWRALQVEGFITATDFAYWWCSQNRAERMVTFLKNSYPDTVLVERHDFHFRFRIRQPDLHIARVFEVIEENKSRIGILEYSVSQTSLEQIFNQFAAKQEEESGKVMGSNMAELL